MFVDQMPSQRVEIDDKIWVEVQYLSKGFKNEERAILSSISTNIKSANGEEREKAYIKIKETEYKRVVAGLRSWSSDRAINIENVKLLLEHVFNKILNAIDEYNTLKSDEIKN